MKKRAVIVLACGGLLAVSYRLASRQGPAELPAPEPAAVAPVSPGDLGAAVKATGVIKPCVGAEVRVGSRVSGVVRRLYVKVGDPVKKGQVLAELDDRDLAARRDQAQAELQRSMAERRFAESDRQRKRDLWSAKVIAPSEMDVAERACAVAEQQVAVARASLAYADIQLSYARIVAPLSGVVASVSTQEGETVSANLEAPTFVTLIDLSRLEVRAYVDETDIGRIAPGQSARFTVDTYGDEEFAGTVATVYPEAEVRDNVVDYVTVVQFNPPPDRILRPEMTTTVRIAVGALAKGARALPPGARIQ